MSSFPLCPGLPPHRNVPLFFPSSSCQRLTPEDSSPPPCCPPHPIRTSPPTQKFPFCIVLFPRTPCSFCCFFLPFSFFSVSPATLPVPLPFQVTATSSFSISLSLFPHLFNDRWPTPESTSFLGPSSPFLFVLPPQPFTPFRKARLFEIRGRSSFLSV